MEKEGKEIKNAPARRAGAEQARKAPVQGAVAKLQSRIETSLDRVEKAFAKKQEKTMYQVRMEAKQLVDMIERENRSHIFLVQSSKGFWKIFGNSALFYLKKVGPFLPKPPTRIEDTDYYVKQDRGIISIPKYERFVENLELYETGIEFDPDINLGIYGEVIRAFKLPRAYSRNAVDNMLYQDKIQKYNVERKVIAVDTIPELATKIKDASKKCYNLRRRILDHKGVPREDGDFYFETEEIYISYIMLANLKKEDVFERMEVLEEMQYHLMRLQGKLFLLINNSVLEYDVINPAYVAVADLAGEIDKAVRVAKGANKIKEKISE